MSSLSYFMIVHMVHFLLTPTMGCNDRNWKSAMETLFSNVGRRMDLTLSPRIMDAILSVDRDCFVDSSFKHWSYDDHPVQLPNAVGATISAPHMHAYALHHLSPYIVSGSCVLDVGSGSGYLTAVISRLIGPSGVVTGIDYQSALIESSKQNIKRWSTRNRGEDAAYNTANIHLLTANIYDFVNDINCDANRCCDGFDAIHVGASADPNIVNALLPIMSTPSRLFVPLKASSYGTEYIYIIDKDEDGNIQKQQTLSVQYVPLVKP
eukprot:542388_1